jgi:hypothetical protein
MVTLPDVSMRIQAFNSISSFISSAFTIVGSLALGRKIKTQKKCSAG